MERIDEIKHNGWHKERSLAWLSIDEIKQTVRLIDMAFTPLVKEMNETINELHVHSKQVFESVVNENQKVDAPTSTEEI